MITLIFEIHFFSHSILEHYNITCDGFFWKYIEHS